MSTLAIIGGVVGILACIPLLLAISNGLKQNMISFGLWATLESMLAISLFEEKGEFIQLCGFALGSWLIVILCITKKQKASWGKLEFFVIFLIACCIIAWCLGGSLVAVVATTCAITLAGIPQMLDIWKDPRNGSVPTWVLFEISNVLTFIGAKDWSIENRLFSGVGTIFCLIFVVLSLRTKNNSLTI